MAAGSRVSLDIKGPVQKAAAGSRRVSAANGAQIKAELAAASHDARLH